MIRFENDGFPVWINPHQVLTLGRAGRWVGSSSTGWEPGTEVRMYGTDRVVILYGVKPEVVAEAITGALA